MREAPVIRPTWVTAFRPVLRLLFCCAFVSAAAASATDLFERASWKNYTYVNDVMALASAGDTLWMATTGGLVYAIVTAPSSVTRLTNADGIGDNDLRFVVFDSSGWLWTGGINGKLSRRQTNGNWAVYDFALNGNLLPLSAASPGPGGILWVGSSIGIHKFDTRRNGGEIKETYTRLGGWPASNPVRDVLVADGFIWAVGPAGVARARVDDPSLPDPAHWRSWTGLPTLNTIDTFHGRVYAGGDDGLYVLADTLSSPGDTNWVRAGLAGVPVYDLYVAGDTIWIATDKGLAACANNQCQGPPALGSPAVSLTSIVRTGGGSLWGGRLQYGLERRSDSGWTSITFDGPMDREFADVAVGNDGTIWCVHPNRGADFLDGDHWTVLPYYDVGPGGPGTSVTVAPDGDVWFGAAGSGAYHVSPSDPLDDWVHYDTSNSSLMWVQDQIGVNNYIVIRDVAVDSSGRVWFANAAADSGRVLAFYDHGCWGSFGTADGLNSNAPQILSARNGELLVGFGNIGFADFTYDPPLCTDHVPGHPRTRTTFKTTSDGLPSNDVRALLLDRADSLWIGTNVGLVRWAADIRRFLKVPLPPEAGLTINAMAADAQNTIWVGTGRGLAMIPSGDTAVFFSPQNSGLVGSNVQEIAVDDRTGNVWIATASGLSRLAAGVPPAPSYDQILAYPNPFTIETDATRQVRFNAPYGSRIYIFTAAGQPVVDFAGGAQGWDGKNASGVLVASGVYLFVVRGSDGGAGRGKIAVIRRR